MSFLLQVDNPVPRVRHPDWLQRRVAAKADIHKQQKISDVFGKKISREEAIEQMQSVRDCLAALARAYVIARIEHILHTMLG
jgi:DNA polymerase epsilon subunit 1